MDTQTLKRRELIKAGLQGAAAIGLSPLISLSSPMDSLSFTTKPSRNGKAVVVRAGAFGGWPALHLLRKGYDVTLIDQFGPGNNQSSSGGETRLIRAFYGDRKIYFDLTLRALKLWKQNEPFMSSRIHQIVAGEKSVINTFALNRLS